MKKINNIKIILFQAVLLLVIFIGTPACNSNKATDTKTVAETSNELKFDNNKQESDAAFLVNAAEINLEEIILGKLAQQKGTASHVTALGKMMQEHHQQSLNTLTGLAKSKMITLPTANTHKGDMAYTKLNEKSGNDFNKAYAEMMVSGHRDAIRIFEKASLESGDADIRAWAVATLPELRSHLDHSILCQKQCEKI